MKRKERRGSRGRGRRRKPLTEKVMGFLFLTVDSRFGLVSGGGRRRRR